MAADETTERFAEITDELIADANRAEAERDAALARVAELEAAISAVNAATQATHDKASDLYWLGRRNIEEAIDGPGGPAIERIMTQHEDEAGKIANGDAWEHGYWAGTLTFLRLIQGLSVTNDYVDEDGEEITTAMIRENAQEEYPMLDS